MLQHSIGARCWLLVSDRCIGFRYKMGGCQLRVCEIKGLGNNMGGLSEGCVDRVGYILGFTQFKSLLPFLATNRQNIQIIV